VSLVLASRKTSASSLDDVSCGKGAGEEETYTSRIASHFPARWNICSRFRSAFEASSPISATLTMNSGFLVVSAIVSAVSFEMLAIYRLKGRDDERELTVFPTPGGP
jgi:hypothetical protein